MTKQSVNKIGKRNSKRYIPQIGDRVAVTHIADKSLRPVLGEFGKVCGINAIDVYLEMDKQIQGKWIHKLDLDEVIVTPIEEEN